MDLKIKYISENEFLLYLDWLTRLKNPFLNFLRVAQKIITKNSIEPKISTKKFEELSFDEKVNLTKYIWEKSINNLLKTATLSDNKLRDFLIYEEEQTFNTAFLLNFLELLGEENSCKNYKKIREDMFLPIDELVEYFSKKQMHLYFCSA